MCSIAQSTEFWLYFILVAAGGPRYGKHNYTSKEEEMYAVTSEVIYRVMELIDGYGRSDMGRLDVICEKTGERLKENPFIELHDVVADYIKE